MVWYGMVWYGSACGGVVVVWCGGGHGGVALILLQFHCKQVGVY